MGFRVQGFSCGVWGSWFGVGFGFWILGFGVWGVGSVFRVWGFDVGVFNRGLGLRI
jgi:hypothetical protein